MRRMRIDVERARSTRECAMSALPCGGSGGGGKSSSRIQTRDLDAPCARFTSRSTTRSAWRLRVGAGVDVVIGHDWGSCRGRCRTSPACTCGNHDMRDMHDSNAMVIRSRAAGACARVLAKRSSIPDFGVNRSRRFFVSSMSRSVSLSSCMRWSLRRRRQRHSQGGAARDVVRGDERESDACALELRRGRRTKRPRGSSLGSGKTGS
jgi:hypothetical protein